MGFTRTNDDVPVRYFLGPTRMNLPIGIGYGDSFMDNLSVYLARNHRRLDVIRTGHIPSRKHGEDLRKSDIIWIERSESDLIGLDIDIDTIYSLFEPEAEIPDRIPVDLGALDPVKGISMQRGAGSVTVKSMGAHSFFELPLSAASESASSEKDVFRVLHLTVTALYADFMTVQYTSDHPITLKRPLKPGPNDLYLPLPSSRSLTVKIFPGSRAGVLTVHSAEIMVFYDGYGKQEIPEQTGLPGQDEIQVASRALNLNQVETRVKEFETTPNVKVDESFAAGLKLSDYEDGRIFQRRGHAADIIVSGRYNGPPTVIEARVIRDEATDPVVAWSAIDAQPENGIFVGVLPDVPQGGWYHIQIRSKDNPRISDAGISRWGVGVLAACLGQSNMKEWFHAGEDLTADPLLRIYGQGGWTPPGIIGNGAIAFGNTMVARLGIPVGLLDFSVNGSGLRKEADWGTGFWEDRLPGGIYDQFVSGVTDAGGALEFAVWTQGEADAARGSVTEGEYRDSLESFITNQIRTDIENASESPNLPFLVVMMVKRPGGKDAPHQAIRNAMRQVTETVADCYPAATTLDLQNQGRQHLAPEAYITLGRRVAQSALYTLGMADYHRGPSVESALQRDAHQLQVRLHHRGGTDFTPDSGLTGWTVIAEGKPVPVSKVYRHDSQTIRIDLARPVNKPIRIRYLYGAMPDAGRAVRDNSDMRLPLEEFEIEIK
ncbi:MAG: hypothetical protein JRH15_03400 [Deltaproteobacteria bacterium]|nr:hypothetical protein [Deltaproteobacteria bacterium]